MKHLVSKEAMHLFCLSGGLTRREKWLLSWRHLKFNFTAVALETLHLAILLRGIPVTHCAGPLHASPSIVLIHFPR